MNEATSGEVVSVHGVIRVADSIRAWRYRNRKYIFTARLSGGLMFLAGIALALYLGEPDPVVALAGIFMIALPSLHGRYISYFLGKTPQLYGEHELEFSENGFRAKNAQLESRQPWTFFASFLESESDFILVGSKAFFQAIPKHLFDDEAHQSRAREMLRRKIASRD